MISDIHNRCFHPNTLFRAIKMSLRATSAKRIRLTEDLFASSTAFDVARRVLVCQPTMAILEKEGEPSKWIHEAHKKDCEDDTDGAPDRSGFERPCTCRFKYFLIFGMFFIGIFLFTISI